jgi:hypothetical protein
MVITDLLLLLSSMLVRCAPGTGWQNICGVLFQHTQRACPACPLAAMQVSGTVLGSGKKGRTGGTVGAKSAGRSAHAGSSGLDVDDEDDEGDDGEEEDSGFLGGGARNRARSRTAGNTSNKQGYSSQVPVWA